MVKPVSTINVVPNLPPALERLQELAYNLRWAWDHETIMLFRRLDPDLWLTTERNPVWMLGLVSQERLQALSADPSFLAHLHRATAAFDDYMAAQNTWYKDHYGQLAEKPVIAYFSTEFGITECLHNYSGGLGILSGDHLKSASDLGLPMVGVGLLYQEGYFQQYLNADGYQQELYPLNDYANQPVTLQTDASGKPITITVPLPGRDLIAQIWKVQVGRIPLYLLDTNISANALAEDRDLTDRLYGGDRRTRIRQEILMGIGGIRALEAMGIHPTICHMNEGHSAFLALERIRLLMLKKDLTFEQALHITAASNVFTTHTPVPAGLERFGYDLIDEHFKEYWSALGLTREQFHDLGRESMGAYDLFSMPVLALKMSSGANGVAKLHGDVSRTMWQWMYPNVPENEVPIGSVTNGIHVQSWVSNEMGGLLDRYLNPDWRMNEEKPEIWADVDKIPDAELWSTHQRRRERLVAFARQRLAMQLERRGVSRSEIESAEEVLNPDALTIGFARRFATYKRATLFMQDIERLRKLLHSQDRPVQFIFAGKAHPHDEGGKAFIREIVNIARDPEFRHSLVFLENYDMLIARYLVQGVDVWLNNPRRPKEASGTSGMKVIYNGGLNCSILDGWWAEAYSTDVGWAIGSGEEYPETESAHQDHVESLALYNILENDIVPLFYNRGRDGLPREWIAKVKHAMIKLAPYFSTRRMVQEYTQHYYMPLYARVEMMNANGDLSKGLAYVTWRQNLNKAWRYVKVNRVDIPQAQIKVGSEMNVSANVYLGQLTPDDVRVQLYYGAMDSHGELNMGGTAVDMHAVDAGSGGNFTFTATVAYDDTGTRGISVRVLPKHDFLPTPFIPGFITWA